MSFSSSPVVGKAMKSESLLNIASSSGNERKISDGVKSFLNLLKEWDELYLAGKIALASIMKRKDGLRWESGNLPSGPKLDALLRACTNLGAVLDGMVGVAHHLQTLAQQIAVISNLQRFQGQKSARLPVFPSGTWNYTKFGTVFQDISNAFHQEVKVLTIIKEAAAQSSDKSTLTSYIARWNNPGCFNTKVIMLINGLLLESSLWTM